MTQPSLTRDRRRYVVVLLSVAAILVATAVKIFPASSQSIWPPSLVRTRLRPADAVTV